MPSPAPAPGVLTHARLLADNNSFMAGQAPVVARLADGDAALAARLSLRPGVEVRSSGRLDLVGDYLLPTAAQRQGGAPMNLTLRAAGDLNITGSLSDGFNGAGAAALVQPGLSAGFRLVAGADLSAADPRSVLPATGAAGSLVIGRAGATPTAPAPDVFLRTSTGAIELHAALDVRLLNDAVRVYTTGLPIDVASLPAWSQLGLLNNQTLRQPNNTPLGPFFKDSGDIRIAAGRDVRGTPTRQYVTDWWWRQTGLAAPGTPAAVWTRYDQFRQGVAAFGGGDVRVQAGRDVLDLEASTPGTGFAVRAVSSADGSVLPTQSLLLAGGTLDVRAGRDVVSGLLYGGGALAGLQAGGAIRPAEVTGLGRSHPGLQLFYGATDWTVQANGSLTLGSLISPGLLSGVVQASGAARGDLVAGLDNGARLNALSVAGDLLLTGSRTALAQGDPRSNSTDPARQVPGQLTLAATAGDVRVDVPLLQRPAAASDAPAASAASATSASPAGLQLLADGNLTLRGATVGALSPAALPTPQARVTATQLLVQDWRQTAEPNPGLDTSDRSPVALVAREGTVQIDADLRSVRPLRVVAGEDLLGGGSASLVVQHQGPQELSVLRAGRDLKLADNASARLRLGGAGDLLILAGRDIDLQGAAGIQTVGNQDNARLLAEGGARVTLVSGVDWGRADYSGAVSGGLLLRGGGAGLVPLTADLAAALSAVAAGAALPPAGSSALATAAAAFASLSPSERAARIDALVGSQRLADLRRDAMRAATGDPALTPEVALRAYAALDDARRNELDAGVRALALAQALAAAPAETATPNPAGIDIAAYTAALLQRWPAERQALTLHDVLFAELRAAGRQAAGLPTGPARDAAYAPGYAALALLYPTPAGRPGTRAPGDIRLTASQIKSQQGGSIRLLAPGGGIDAGALVGSVGKPASDLGIITTSGGSIEAAARDDFAVNQSRVFTLARGDLLLWSSEGNIDAGRGAKTVTGAPPPVVTIDRDGNVVVDTSGSFSGSGIAVLDPASTLDLFAPRGEISAGEAGIASRGTAFLGAQVVRGDDIKVGSGSVGAPAAPDLGGATAGLALTSNNANPAAGAQAKADEDEDERKRRKPRRNLLLEFLGFGNAP